MDEKACAADGDRQAALRNARTKNRWTAVKEAIFFEELAATCNITHAAAKAGMHVRSAYHRKYGDPRFAARWAEALEAGYTELETMLLRHALEGAERVETVTGADGELKQVRRVRSFPHALAARLLGRHGEAMERYRAMEAMRLAEDPGLAGKIRAELAKVRARLQEGRAETERGESDG